MYRNKANVAIVAPPSGRKNLPAVGSTMTVAAKVAARQSANSSSSSSSQSTSTGTKAAARKRVTRSGSAGSLTTSLGSSSSTTGEPKGNPCVPLNAPSTPTFGTKTGTPVNKFATSATGTKGSRAGKQKGTDALADTPSNGASRSTGEPSEEPSEAESDGAPEAEAGRSSSPHAQLGSAGSGSAGSATAEDVAQAATSSTDPPRSTWHGFRLYLPERSPPSQGPRSHSPITAGAVDQPSHLPHDQPSASLLSSNISEHTKVMLGLTLAIKDLEVSILSLDSMMLRYALRDARSRVSSQHSQSAASDSNDGSTDDDDDDDDLPELVNGSDPVGHATGGTASGSTPEQIVALEAVAISAKQRARIATGHEECLAQTRESYTAMTGIRLSPNTPYTQEEAEDSYIVWRNKDNLEKYEATKAAKPDEVHVAPEIWDKMKPGCKVPLLHFLRDAEGHSIDVKRLNRLREFLRARKLTLLHQHGLKKEEEKKKRAAELANAKGKGKQAADRDVANTEAEIKADLMVTVAGELVPFEVFELLKRDAAVAFAELRYCPSDWKVAEILVRMGKKDRRRIKSEPDDESMEIDGGEEDDAPSGAPSGPKDPSALASKTKKRPFAAISASKLDIEASIHGQSSPRRVPAGPVTATSTQPGLARASSILPAASPRTAATNPPTTASVPFTNGFTMSIPTPSPVGNSGDQPRPTMSNMSHIGFGSNYGTVSNQAGPSSSQYRFSVPSPSTSHASYPYQSRP
ncbi:hypothetical protein OC834_000645 [Tilletia horrida]|nr:hypothetical protein OC834_000645 [Tilletia horrida]